MSTHGNPVDTENTLQEARLMARILVIDDEPGVRAALDQALRLAGHTVLLAENGPDGLKQYRADPPDLIIIDLLMPKPSGIETIVELRKLAGDAKIIAISGNPAGEDTMRRHNLGAVSFLEKPFAITDLLATVDKALAKTSPPSNTQA